MLDRGFVPGPSTVCCCSSCETHTAIYPGGTDRWEQDHPGEPFPDAPPADASTTPAATPGPAPAGPADEAITPAAVEGTPASSTAEPDATPPR